MPMLNPPHPGENLREDVLAPLGLSVTETAKALGVSRKTLSEIVNGKSPITPDIAVRLERAFAAPPPRCGSDCRQPTTCAALPVGLKIHRCAD